jgi:hypothetical protein
VANPNPWNSPNTVTAARVFGRKPKSRIEPSHVLERLVDHRHADNGIDDVGIRANAAKHAGQERDAVADRKQAHILDDLFEAVQEEDDPDQEHQMVVAGHHVLGAEVEKRTYCGSVD